MFVVFVFVFFFFLRIMFVVVSNIILNELWDLAAFVDKDWNSETHLQ